jgi:hypothetical protein
MASKKPSGSKQPARKKKVPIKDLSSPSRELSDGQARAVKGGANEDYFLRIKGEYQPSPKLV